ncbi:MAG: hypothetical protein PHD82_05455, partial [Candidatus Riflebacteria bacterium]|nr:hypothetical protein [Candidatus Riflebacteria bacterium]
YGNNFRRNKPTGRLPKPQAKLVANPLPWNARKLVHKNFGHRAGLCQDGAIGMGLIGYSARQILAFYYPGTRLETLHYAGPGLEIPAEPLNKPIILAAAPKPEPVLIPLEGPINPTQISALIKRGSPAPARKSNIMTALKEISTVKAGNTGHGIRKVFWTPAAPGLSKNRRIF